MYWGGGKQYTGFWKSNKKHGKVRACVRYARACACACACAGTHAPTHPPTHLAATWCVRRPCSAALAP